MCLRRERQRMVRRRMWSVRIAVVRVVGVIMPVVVKDHFSDRLQQPIRMRCRRKMEGNVIEIEGEQRSDEQTTPPTRRFWREATSVLLAHIHEDHG